MKLSMRTLLPLLLFAAFVISGVIMSFVIYNQSQDRMLASSREKLLAIGNLLSANVETGIRYNQTSIVQSAIEQSQAAKMIKYSLLVNDKDIVYSANWRSLEGHHISHQINIDIVKHIRQNSSPYEISSVPSMPHILVYQVPLARQSANHPTANLVNRLILIADISAELNQARRDLTNDILLWMLFSSISAFFIWLILNRIFVKPVEYLKTLVTRIAEGDENLPTAPNMTAELRQFDRIVKSMAMDIHDLQRHYRELYDKNPATFLTVDRSGGLVNINKYGVSISGYRKAEIIGRPASVLYHPDDRPLFDKYINALFDNNKEVTHWELRRISKNGQVTWIRDGARVINYQGKQVVLIVSQDITDTHHLHDKLNFQATHDDLTGLINRTEFSRLLQLCLDKTHIQDTINSVCVLDLDQFKLVNDTCGHGAGDAMLQQIARIFQEHMRKDDILARIGGDEFAILLESCTPRHATSLIEQLRQKLDDYRFNWDDKFFDIGLSAGISVIDKHTSSIQKVLSEADSACYTAKDLGRAQTVIYGNDNDNKSYQLMGEMKWVTRINSALASNEGFQLHFQEIVPLGNEESNLLKGEILIRMLDADGTTVPPGAFLPAAERYNLASKVDLWVIMKTIDMLSEYRRYMPEQWNISINLSAQSLSSSQTLNELLTILESHRDLCPHLCFEITETSAMANYANGMEFMRLVKQFGCEFALDDFGSGFCSFGYLKTMPVDYVKIDGMFIRDLAKDTVDYALVMSMNHIAHTIGKQTIAEFVENNTSVAKLNEIKVDYAQGYHFHKPEPFKHVLQRLAHESDSGNVYALNLERKIK